MLVTEPDEGVPSSGELESMVVPGVSLGPAELEGPPVEIPDEPPCVVSQGSEEVPLALTVEFPLDDEPGPALTVDDGLGTVMTVVTDPLSSVPVEDPLAVSVVRPLGVPVPLESWLVPDPVGVGPELAEGDSGEALSTALEKVDDTPDDSQ
ncbi:hypothetical protein IMZ48_33705 [Candidatus Bathyarchaeota archaeon]|nr:hypothetical protein [Candidatus Bathyarchaeota archaeon]